jgi:glycerol transport system ATP-binding protein
MNIVPATVDGNEARIDGHVIRLTRAYDRLPAGAAIEIGVRPEFVHVAPPAPGLLAAKIDRIDDLGSASLWRNLFFSAVILAIEVPLGIVVVLSTPG